ncbi:MAG: preprotein translocase subunit YajC [bacterium]|jgi:preprotein translocase subunit YajC
MFDLIPEVLAQGAGKSGGPSAIMQFLPFILVFVVFYFLVIRPQQKKTKEHQSLVSNLSNGDEVVTNSGVFGKVNKVFDEKDFILLEIAEKTVIKIQKNSIAEVTKSKNKPEVTKGKDKPELTKGKDKSELTKGKDTSEVSK